MGAGCGRVKDAGEDEGWLWGRVKWSGVGIW